MPFDEPDPKLEATTRLFTGDLEKFFDRYVFPKARPYSAATDEVSKRIEELSEIEEFPEEVVDEQGRLARSQELEGLEFLLEKVRRAASFFAIRRFSRCANALQDELIRGKVARAVVERLAPLIAQVFTLFNVPEQAETWAAELECWLVNELQRIPDRDIATRTTDQQAVDQRTQQIGDRAVSGQPPQSGAPVPSEEARHTQVSIIERIRSSERKALHVVIEMFKTANSGESDTKAILQGVDGMIRGIRSEAERTQVWKAVHDSVPPGWKERIGKQQTLFAFWDKSSSKERGRIKTYVSDVNVSQ